MNPVPPPPQNSGYYRPNPQGPLRGPGIHFDSISTAWTIITKNPGIWIGGSLIYIVSTIPLTLVAMLVQNNGVLIPQLGAETDLPRWWQGEAISVLNSILSMCLYSGMIKMGIKAAYDDSPSIKDLFSQFGRIWPIAGATFLCTLCVAVGTVALIVPGMFLCGALAMTLPILIEQKVGVIESMKRSFELLKPHAWSMFGLLLVSGLATGLGYLACCVGLIVTLPITPLVLGIHYSYFFPRDVQPAAYNFLEPPR